MEVTPRNWLITGGCGFIGTSLIAHLLKHDPLVKIRVLDNHSVGTRHDLAEVSDIMVRAVSDLSEQIPSGKTELVIGDIRDFEACRKSCLGVDIVIHLAANTGVGPSVDDPRADMESNVIGTFNMLEAARGGGVHTFIFASSGAPVGECQPPIHEELAPHPVSPYGASKLAGEGYCSAYFRTFGIKTVSLRFGNVYGPGSGHKNSLVAKFIKQAIEGEVCEIYGNGTQTRDFIYIDDLIQAIRKAADPVLLPPGPDTEFSSLSPQSLSFPWGETFQIATSKEHTINEVTGTIKSLLERKQGIFLQVVHGSTRKGDVKRNFSDTAKALRVLDWKATVELEEGIERTVDWFLTKPS